MRSLDPSAERFLHTECFRRRTARILQTIQDLFKEQTSLTRAEIEKALGVSSSTACRIIKSILGDGVVAAEGNGRSVRYRLK